MNSIEDALRNGPSEIWAPVPGYVGLYEVSTFGRVRSLDRWCGGIGGRRRLVKGVLLKPTPNKSGYLRIALRRGGLSADKVMVHRLVAQAFIPNPQSKPIVHHKDGNPANNRAENLEWTTPQENIRASYGEGSTRTNSTPVIMDEAFYFFSAAQAGRHIGTHGHVVSRACRSNKLLKGHSWRFAKSDESPDLFAKPAAPLGTHVPATAPVHAD